MKRSIKKRRKICIFLKSMVLVKISNFFIFSLWENRLRRVFGDVLGRILACVDYENIN